jgi:hypothetical protein
MKCFIFFIILFSHKSESVELFIYDHNRYVDFLIVGNDSDSVNVLPTALYMGLGMNISISGEGGLYALGGSDGKVGKASYNYLAEGGINGRRIPKQMIAFLYGIKSVGNYHFKINICLNSERCLPEKTVTIFFSDINLPKK